MACASALTEMVAGQTVDETRALHRDDIDRGCRRLAAGLDTCGAIGSGCAVGGAAASQTLDSPCPTSHIASPHRLPAAERHRHSRCGWRIGARGGLHTILRRRCARGRGWFADHSGRFVDGRHGADRGRATRSGDCVGSLSREGGQRNPEGGARFLGSLREGWRISTCDIATIAGAVGAMDRGEEVIAAMQRRIADVRARTGTMRAAAGLVRGMGQATDRFADMGRGIGRGCGRASSWASRDARSRLRRFAGLIRK